MANEMMKAVEAAIKIAAVQNKPKDRNLLNKKGKRKFIIAKSSDNPSSDYVHELKKQLTYGDTGHGLLLDKKV